MSEIIATQRQILAEAPAGTSTDDPAGADALQGGAALLGRGAARPPDDVTVVFTDDNWGNIRKLPDRSLPPRSGGYGLYYHFDYVGGGRNYKWVDTAHARQHLGAAAPGVHLRESTGCGWPTSAT